MQQLYYHAHTDSVLDELRSQTGETGSVSSFRVAQVGRHTLGEHRRAAGLNLVGFSAPEAVSHFALTLSWLVPAPIKLNHRALIDRFHCALRTSSPRRRLAHRLLVDLSHGKCA
jgi:hypothetical protein